MEEKEIALSLYNKYGKRKLNLRELCEEIGMSYSKASKYFGGPSSYSEKFIKEHRLLPIWDQPNGEQRRWKLSEIAKWLCHTEVQND